MGKTRSARLGERGAVMMAGEALEVMGMVPPD